MALVGKTLADLKNYKEFEINETKKLGKEGILFWEQKIASFQKLSKIEALKLLIKAEKIEAKIKTINKTINLKITL